MVYSFFLTNYMNFKWWLENYKGYMFQKVKENVMLVKLIFAKFQESKLLTTIL